MSTLLRHILKDPFDAPLALDWGAPQQWPPAGLNAGQTMGDLSGASCAMKADSEQVACIFRVGRQ
jgi:hypothetical protein